MKVPDLYVGKQLFVGTGSPTALGIGPVAARGSAYIEGPTITGDPSVFPFAFGCANVGPPVNAEAIPPVPIIPGFVAGFNHSPYSLAVVGDAAIFNDLTVNGQIEVGTNLIAQGEVIARVLGKPHILSVKKDFDIKHPTKEGWRLTHACLEGPEAGVYYRGKTINNDKIILPEYWKGLVDEDTITVNITPVKYHQNIMIEKIEDNIVFLNEKDGLEINCHFHVYGERVDTEKLIPEYEGEIEDYPGDNSQRSIVGWNYDVKK
jgi:hypothetical protein